VDPHARTLRGFCALTEKEWASFGHRFAKRCGTGGCGYDRADHADDQRAPIFLQWLDAVWQVWRQAPAAFEFSEALLVALADHAYAGRFGTFLYDCERDRVTARLRETTVSLWSYVLHPAVVGRFTNARYVAPAEWDGGGGGGGGGAALLLGDATTTLLPDTRDEALAVWPLWASKWAAR